MQYFQHEGPQRLVTAPVIGVQTNWINNLIPHKALQGVTGFKVNSVSYSEYSAVLQAVCMSCHSARLINKLISIDVDLIQHLQDVAPEHPYLAVVADYPISELQLRLELCTQSSYIHSRISAFTRKYPDKITPPYNPTYRRVSVEMYTFLTR